MNSDWDSLIDQFTSGPVRALARMIIRVESREGGWMDTHWEEHCCRDTSKSALNGSITRDFLQRTCPEISNRKTQITDNIQTTNPNSLTFQCITACSAL